MCNLIEYRALLEELANEQSSEIFSNSSKEHASIVFMTFFKNAQQRLCILEDALDGKVSTINEDEFFTLLDKFVKEKKLSLEMIVKDKVDETSKIYKTLRSYFDQGYSNVNVHQSSSEELIKLDPIFKNINNLAVIDRKGFRIDVSSPDSNQQTTSNQALCSFNYPSKAEKYQSSFDKVFNQLHPLFQN